MRLDQALVERHLCESKQIAQECIESGFVILDGKVITKKTRQVDENSEIQVTQVRKFVSRGGEKLENALLTVYGNESSARSNLINKKALDIGSSTGGFTDCLLSYGVKTVTAVDVGTSQFHKKLRTNPQITLFEQTDIRDFITKDSFDIIVADLSFISLDKVLDTVLSFGISGSEFFLLIKPQFEVGLGNTKKGIVKDQELVTIVLQKYITLLNEKGAQKPVTFPSAVVGGDGNQEYFIYFKK